MRRLIFVAAAACVLFVGCKKDVLEYSIQVTTNNVDYLSPLSATLYGTGTFTHSIRPWSICFQYSTTSDFSDNKVEEAYWEGSNRFSRQIRDLTPATRYYYRALVVQRDHYTYGETKEFTTLPVSAMIETLDYAIEKEGYVTLKGQVDLSNIPYYTSQYGLYAGASESSLELIISWGGTPSEKIFSDEIPDTRFSSSRIFYKAFLKLNDVEYFGELKCYEKSNQ